MRSQKLLFAIALCMCLSVVVSAHPGGTSSDGGHTNHSTGEYHYHHGYSAHQHYDMDGDGDWDCPYSFDDKTNSSGNKNESSSIKTKSHSYKKDLPSIKTELPSNDTEPVKNGNSKKSKDYTWLFLIIGCLVMYGVPLLVEEIKWRFKK